MPSFIPILALSVRITMIGLSGMQKDKRERTREGRRVGGKRKREEFNLILIVGLEHPGPLTFRILSSLSSSTRMSPTVIAPRTTCFVQFVVYY